MIFTELGVSGAFELHPEPIADSRGLFARVWDADDMTERGLIGEMRQANVGFSPTSGTFRGLHLQHEPHAEAKLARCTMGQAFDVVADLRPGSPTRGRWAGVVIDPVHRNMVYVPPGCAHGYLTLEPDTEVQYLTSQPYAPDSAYGIRHDDPAIGIELPAAVTVISEADQSWPDVVL
jgi:dTDP-4-dehydrorhamnose 3,5-epimerase